MKNIPPQQLHTSNESLQPSGGSDSLHIPVLLEDVVGLLNPRSGERYLDLTAGYAGHASRIIDVVGPENATLVDRDLRALEHLRGYGRAGTTLIHSDFAGAAQHLVETKTQFDMVLVDLGVSSPQLDMAERGFSIKRDGPLDMRMDESQQKTAADIINRTSEKELTRIIEEYGEERRAMAARIAHTIRLNRPLRTTSELVNVILKTHRGGWKKVHPATRTFQAIRIALNDELSQIERLMPLLPTLLRPGGRVAIISFHSLEDRIVKQYFAEQERSGYEATMKLLTKKPILGAKHDTTNPRARSAILRAAVKP